MKKQVLIPIIGVALFLSACHSTVPSANVKQVVEGVSQVSSQSAKELNQWQGSYKGLLPCASCDGISTTLELKNNNTYVQTQQYAGETKIHTDKGQFNWDKSGNFIQLDANVGGVKVFLGKDFVQYVSEFALPAKDDPMATLYRLERVEK